MFIDLLWKKNTTLISSYSTTRLYKSLWERLTVRCCFVSPGPATQQAFKMLHFIHWGPIRNVWILQIVQQFLTNPSNLPWETYKQIKNPRTPNSTRAKFVLGIPASSKYPQDKRRSLSEAQASDGTLGGRSRFHPDFQSATSFSARRSPDRHNTELCNRDAQFPREPFPSDCHSRTATPCPPTVPVYLAIPSMHASATTAGSVHGLPRRSKTWVRRKGHPRPFGSRNLHLDKHRYTLYYTWLSCCLVIWGHMLLRPKKKESIISVINLDKCLSKFRAKTTIFMERRKYISTKSPTRMKNKPWWLSNYHSIQISKDSWFRSTYREYIR